MKKCIILLLTIAVLTSCHTETSKMEERTAQFIDSLEQVVSPVEKSASLAYFNATTTGNSDEYDKAARLNIDLSKIYSDRGMFATIKMLKESGKVKDSLLARQLDLLYDGFLANQVDTAILEERIKAEMILEEKFSKYRTIVDGKKYTDNEVEDILKTSADNRLLEKIWKASKQIGDSVAGNVIALVKMRNEIAHQLGFGNFYEMSLRLSDQDPGEVEALFDELDELTAGAFAQIKTGMDSVLASKYGIKPENLMPWHYQNRFFQEAPSIYNVNLDSYFEEKDVVEVARNFYAGIGLNVDSVLAKSDLYEKEGKYQHAYCTNIDRNGDVRIVCNVKNDAYWMNTMLHELGHAVYDRNINKGLPYFLRSYAHTFTTEAIANMFGRMSSNPEWLKANAGVTEEEATRIGNEVNKSLQLEQLIFSRWSQVIFRFEKSMYENPDQDLNSLWWNLVTKYQLLKKPEGRNNNADWASKIHIALYPCYYHNYLLGELLASQLSWYIRTNVLNTPPESIIDISGHPEAGQYLREKVFYPGASLPWSEMIRKATGEELTAKYYSMDFIKTY
jgi:peptidyl-dipeptidase A